MVAAVVADVAAVAVDAPAVPVASSAGKMNLSTLLLPSREESGASETKEAPTAVRGTERRWIDGRCQSSDPALQSTGRTEREHFPFRARLGYTVQYLRGYSENDLSRCLSWKLTQL